MADVLIIKSMYDNDTNDLVSFSGISVKASRVPNGFPCVVDVNEGPVDEVNDYLLDLYFHRCSISSVKSAQTYAEHLADWFATLKRSDISWGEVTKTDIVTYRNALLESYDRNAVGLSDSTINDRIKCVLRFYKWAFENGYEVSGSLANQINDNNKYHICRNRNRILIREYKKIPRAIDDELLNAILGKLSPAYKLIANWSLMSGARRSEVLSVTIGDVLNAETEVDGMTKVPVRAKGGGERPIYIPNKLFSETKRYLIVDDVRNFAGEDASRQPLFVGKSGYAITPAAVTASFYRAVKVCGISKRIRFHDLRHTYAIRTLRKLNIISETRDIAPMKVLQNLLGHKSIATTEIYTKSLRENPEVVMDMLGYLFGEEVGGLE